MKFATVASVVYPNGDRAAVDVRADTYYVTPAGAQRRRAADRGTARELLNELDRDCNMGDARLVRIDDAAVAALRA